MCGIDTCPKHFFCIKWREERMDENTGFVTTKWSANLWHLHQIIRAGEKHTGNPENVGTSNTMFRSLSSQPVVQRSFSILMILLFIFHLTSVCESRMRCEHAVCEVGEGRLCLAAGPCGCDGGGLWASSPGLVRPPQPLAPPLCTRPCLAQQGGGLGWSLVAQSQNKLLGFWNPVVSPCSCAGPTEEPSVGFLCASAPALPRKVSKHWSQFLLQKCN